MTDDSIVEEYDMDGDGTTDATVEWTDQGGDSNYYESGEVTMDVDGDGTDETYTMTDTDEDGYVDNMTGDFDGNGTTDEWDDTDGDGVVDSNEISM